MPTPPIRTIDVFTDSRGPGKCKACGEHIVWAQIARSGKKMCFNLPAVALKTGKDEVTGRFTEAIEFATNHWASCPGAEQFKTPKAGA